PGLDTGSRITDPGKISLLSESWIEAMPAARFVGTLRTDQDAFAAGHESLRMVRRRAAHHADGECLRNVFGNRQQLRHRLPRVPPGNLGEAGHDPEPAPGGGRVSKR